MRGTSLAHPEINITIKDAARQALEVFTLWLVVTGGWKENGQKRPTRYNGRWFLGGPQHITSESKQKHE